MYAQITNLCNMTCAHCCFNHGPTKNPTHMSWEHWIDTLSLTADYNSWLNIGGGEPTSHPNFKKMLEEALEYPDIEGIWLATNGKIKSTAFWLLELMDHYQEIKEAHKFRVELSQDPWHDPIDPAVVHAFRQRKAVRDVSRNIKGLVNQGRAQINRMAPEDNYACCGVDLHINPDGTTRICSCTDSPIIGHVSQYLEIPEWMDGQWGECYQNMEIPYNYTIVKAA